MSEGKIHWHSTLLRRKPLLLIKSIIFVGLFFNITDLETVYLACSGWFFLTDNEKWYSDVIETLYSWTCSYSGQYKRPHRGLWHRFSGAPPVLYCMCASETYMCRVRGHKSEIGFQENAGGDVRLCFESISVSLHCETLRVTHSPGLYCFCWTLTFEMQHSEQIRSSVTIRTSLFSRGPRALIRVC